MSPNLRSRLVLATTTIVLVITLSSVTAFVALRSMRAQVAASRQIDRQVALLDRLRTESRELSLSARRYMISLNLQEKQHFFAVSDDLKKDQQQLDARHLLPKGPVLDADMNEYVSALTFLISDYEDDPIARLTRFEDQLVRIRAPLSSTFDDIIAAQRSQRQDLRSAQTLASGAQWTVAIAGFLGILLAVGGCLTLLQRPRVAADPVPSPASPDVPDQPAVLR